jgi:hypothetical protein
MRRTTKTPLLALLGFLLLAASAAARQFRTPVYLAFTDLGQVGIMLGKGNRAFESAPYFNVPDALQLAVGNFNGDQPGLRLAAGDFTKEDKPDLATAARNSVARLTLSALL